jgi:hypothetical protein
MEVNILKVKRVTFEGAEPVISQGDCFINLNNVQGFEEHPNTSGVWIVEFGYFEDNFIYIKETKKLFDVLYGGSV